MTIKLSNCNLFLTNIFNLTIVSKFIFVEVFIWAIPKLYDLFNEELRTYDIEVLTGQFGADMKINLLNDGPVTIIYDENL